MTELQSLPSMALLGAALLTPLAVATLLTLSALAHRVRALDLAAASALPACLAALWLPDGYVAFDWVLLGSRLGLDTTGRVFLGFTSFLWLAAGVFARGYLRNDPRVRRFFGFFLLSMAGNLGLVMAQDAVSFFCFFTLMSLAAYGLVVHEPTPDNLRAGRVYIVLAIVSEVLVFSALLLLSRDTQALAFPLSAVASLSQPLVLALILLGFGIKVGALPLHVWLPLAHPAAPTPASAVLSGAMIKAGLLGWLRFLPLGELALPELGAVVAGAGLLAAYYGVAAGVVQRDPKTVLAYSSVSQMGFMTVAVGLGLAAPEAWPALLLAVLVYAVHHGLAKSTLFLGVGLVMRSARRVLVVCGMALAALALAGAPLTSGALAKSSLKLALAEVAGSTALLALALSLAAVGTTLLMARTLLLVVRLARGDDRTHGGWMWGAAVGSVAGVAAGALMVPGATATTTDLAAAVNSGWPVVLGALLALVAWRLAPATLPRWLRIPPGDLVVPVAVATVRIDAAWRALASRVSAALVAVGARVQRDAPARARNSLLQLEQLLNEWPVIGLCVLMTLLVLWGLLV